jgi:hypothetical protein
VRCARCLALLFAALISPGCLVLSLQPAYDNESIVSDDALVGSWSNTDDQTEATIERGEWRSYRITYKDRFATRTFQGNLTKIGAATFLDLTELRGVDPGPYLVPVHGVFRVEIAGNTLTATPFDYNWFSRAIAQKTMVRLSAAVDDRRNAIVTSPTPEFRRWLAQVPDEAFAASMTFRKIR